MESIPPDIENIVLADFSAGWFEFNMFLFL